MMGYLFVMKNLLAHDFECFSNIRIVFHDEESLFYQGLKIWELNPHELRHLYDLKEFKEKNKIRKNATKNFPFISA